MEVVTASTDSKARLTINMAHCLLGHQNEDSVQKTVRELDWILMCQPLQLCDQCQVQAKQKNVCKESVTLKLTYLDIGCI